MSLQFPFDFFFCFCAMPDVNVPAWQRGTTHPTKIVVVPIQDLHAIYITMQVYIRITDAVHVQAYWHALF
jgi:hypothetical protein